MDNKGCLHVYTGNGKGKTTAALGLALRAAGAGHRVWIGQFIKGADCSEHAALERFADLITISQFGRGCFITSQPGAEDIAQAREGLIEASRALTSGEYQLVVLDEAALGCYFNLYSVEELIEIIRNRADHVEVVITGRYAPQELMEEADLVTEMKEIKHYYRQGVLARVGIEK